MQEINKGEWEKLLKYYEPQQVCGDWRVDQAILEADALTQLTPVMFLGPVLLVGISVLIALVMRAGISIASMKAGVHRMSGIQYAVVASQRRRSRTHLELAHLIQPSSQVPVAPKVMTRIWRARRRSRCRSFRILP